MPVLYTEEPEIKRRIRRTAVTSTASELRRFDHRSWLNDIERLQHDLKVWNASRERKLARADANVVAVLDFLHHLRVHQEAVKQLQLRIKAYREARRSPGGITALNQCHHELSEAVNNLHQKHRVLRTMHENLEQQIISSAEQEIMTPD